MKRFITFSLLIGIITQSHAQTAWQLSGNAGTVPGTHFIGTTDNADIIFKRNKITIGSLREFNISFGTYALANNTGVDNIAIGNYALQSNTNGGYNTAVGVNALYQNTTGYNNVSIGMSSLTKNTIGHDNTATGMWALTSNSTGYYNTATGSRALMYNTTGTYNTATGANALYWNSSGYNNVAVGLNALYSNTDGYNNTATGMWALNSNSSGYLNTATGAWSLMYNTTGVANTASGAYALQNTTTGSQNVATGTYALQNNTTGLSNVTSGSYSLYNNTTGNHNTASGQQALFGNTIGGGNTSFGGFALSANTIGSVNTAIGFVADVSSPDLDNATAIGYASTATASNQVRIGNSSVTSIGGYTGWTNFSDGRFKKEVKENVPGLEFIRQLKPVTYRLDVTGINNYIRKNIKDKDGKQLAALPEEAEMVKQKEQVVYTGFIAQDVEAAAKKLNYSFSGVDAPKNSQDLYGLRYAEFVMPLVKSVQELSDENDKLKSGLEQMKSTMEQMQTQLAEAIRQLKELKGSSTTLSNEPAAAGGIKVYPNPANGSFTLETARELKNAAVLLFDMNGNAQPISVKTISENKKEIKVSSLSKGTYLVKLVTGSQSVSSRIVLQ